MDRPKDLFDIDELRARGKAYEEHCRAEYERADKERDELIALHCRDQNERAKHWSSEWERILRINRALAGHGPPG